MSDIDPVILVCVTVMDGTVVRWYRSVSVAERHTPTVSASRNGVMIHGEYLTSVPPEWIEAARAAHEQLRQDRRVDLTHLATHRHGVVPSGPLVPVDRAEG